ncbi:MAG: hypothetical protein FJW96_09060 [Actinobacteria bacterium]|nr:hypothetical protein [Actinomycetota bacterium]
MVDPAKVSCRARRRGSTVRVDGVLAVEKLQRGLTVLVEGTESGRFRADLAALAGVDPQTGRFSAVLRLREERLDGVVCLFGGTETLATAGAGPVRIR